jgi:hypothetical protein
MFGQPVDEIDYLTSAANYVDIHVGEQVIRTRATISSLEQQLDPYLFGRIHRKTIVNVSQIKGWRSIGHGDYLLTLYGGDHLRVSRRYRRKIMQIVRRHDAELAPEQHTADSLQRLAAQDEAAAIAAPPPESRNNPTLCDPNNNYE